VILIFSELDLAELSKLESFSGQEKIYLFLKNRDAPVAACELRRLFGSSGLVSLRKLVKRKDVVKIVPPFPILGKLWYVVTERADEFTDYWLSDAECFKRYEAMYSLLWLKKN